MSADEVRMTGTSAGGVAGGELRRVGADGLGEMELRDDAVGAPDRDVARAVLDSFRLAATGFVVQAARERLSIQVGVDAPERARDRGRVVVGAFAG